MRDYVIYNIEDIAANFDTGALARGQQYYQQGRVLRYTFDSGKEGTKEQSIAGTIRGSGQRQYDVEVQINYDDDDPYDEAYVELSGWCDCPVTHDCKHVVALLMTVRAEKGYRSPVSDLQNMSPYERLANFASYAEQKSSALDQESFKRWLQDFTADKVKQTTKTAEEVVLYFLDIGSLYSQQPTLQISLSISRRLKRGGYGKAKRFAEGNVTTERAQTLEDKRLIALMKALNKKEYYDYESFQFTLGWWWPTINRFISDGACFLAAIIGSNSLRLGGEEKADRTMEDC